MGTGLETDRERERWERCRDRQADRQTVEKDRQTNRQTNRQRHQDKERQIKAWRHRKGQRKTDREKRQRETERERRKNREGQRWTGNNRERQKKEKTICILIMSFIQYAHGASEGGLDPPPCVGPWEQRYVLNPVPIKSKPLNIQNHPFISDYHRYRGAVSDYCTILPAISIKTITLTSSKYCKSPMMFVEIFWKCYNILIF